MSPLTGLIRMPAIIYNDFAPSGATRDRTGANSEVSQRRRRGIVVVESANKTHEPRQGRHRDWLKSEMRPASSIARAQQSSIASLVTGLVFGHHAVIREHWHQ